MENPLVSVCVPAFNAERYIGAALDSLLEQSYPAVEIIVVNDGSTDGTGVILEAYIPKGVRVIHQNNSGQCAAANRAFQSSSGKYIKFFDADDLLSSDFIAKQVERLREEPDAIASASWGRFFSDDLSSFALQRERVYKDMLPMDWLLTSLDEGPNMMQCGLWLIPRKLLSVSGLWDERLSLINDFDFFIRVILASKKILFTDDAVLYYRSGIESSLSGQKSKRAMESAFLSTDLGVKTILSCENSARTRKVGADAFQLWKYHFYPEHMSLFEKAEQRVKELGGSAFPYPSGGLTKVMVQLIGWKKTKKIKRYLNRKVD